MLTDTVPTEPIRVKKRLSEREAGRTINSGEEKHRDMASYLVDTSVTIREAFRQSAVNRADCVFVKNADEKVLGIVTDGDFRRAIWAGVSLEEPVSSIINRRFIYLEPRYKISDVISRFSRTNIRQIPVLREGRLIDLIVRDDYTRLSTQTRNHLESIPMVIMAGGKGTRLAPFTHVLPKPLMPIGDKPIIEHIIDKFAGFGIRTFYISIKYKQKLIRAYFEDFESDYEIRFLEEEKYLGTAGALARLAGQITTPFFVTNCDILINSDYYEIFEFHKQQSHDLTLVGSLQQHIIPYGICRIRDGGALETLCEKPRYDFLANTGLYVINPEVLSLIPQNRPFDMTDLIESLQQAGRSVGVYPVSGESWIDVGQWEEYRKAVEQNPIVVKEGTVHV